MRVWKKEEIPEELHYTNSDRIPDLFLSADNRWDILLTQNDWDKVNITDFRTVLRTH